MSNTNNLLTDEELNEYTTTVERVQHLEAMGKADEVLIFAKKALLILLSLWDYKKYSAHRTALANSIRSAHAFIRNLIPD